MNTTPDSLPSTLAAGPMARLARVPSSWLKAEARAGKIPCLAAGRSLIFNPRVVLQVLAERAASDRCGEGKGAAHA